MTSVRARRPRAAQQGLVVAVLLVGLAAWPWLSPIPASTRTPPAGDGMPAAVALPPLPAAEAFAATADRPLFSPSRRPRASAAAMPARATEPRYRLLGVITVGDDRRALIAAGARHVEVREGGRFEGGVVRRIEEDRVIVTGAEGEVVLSLPHGAAATSAPPR